jgi:hypothetical protein
MSLGRGRALGLAGLLTLGVGLAPVALAQQPSAPAPQASEAPASPSAAAPPAVKLPLEEKALGILKASSRRLSAAHTMSFTAVVSYESPSRLGPPLVYTTRSAVTLQRPDKLRVIQSADGPASEFYYNGKTMTAFAPAENLVAVAQAPGTIDAALEQAYRQAAIYFPFTDVMVADPYKDIAQGLELAFYIGQSRVVGGTTTDMVAYATYGVFVQVWIGAEDKLPRRARAVYEKDPLRLRHEVDFSEWKLGGPVPTAAFTSARAARAKPIPFVHPDPEPEKTPTPPAAAPSKTR